MTYKEDLLEWAYRWLDDAKWWLKYGSDGRDLTQCKKCLTICEERIAWLEKELKK